jgi:hypothetical protein
VSLGSARLVIRKARAPVAFVKPALFDAQGNLTSTVAFEPSNGPPSHAMLLPVQVHNDCWRLSDHAGRPVDQPQSTDLHSKSVRLRDARSDTLHIVDVVLPWPDDSEHALLLLLYSQVADIGDDSGVETFEYEIETLPETRHAHILRKIPQNIESVLRCLKVEPSSSLERGVVYRRPNRATSLEPILANVDAISTPSVSFAFALASCQYPAGMLDAGVRSQHQALADQDLGPAEISLWRLAGRLQRDGSHSFTVLAGDQVYVDATAGLFDSRVLHDKFSFAYDSMFKNRGLQRLLRFGGADLLPMLDDHEVDDNWEPLPRPPAMPIDAKEKLLPTGRNLYLERQRSMWPFAADTGRLYQAATLHGAHFFFADARTERDGRSVANYAKARIMSDDQLTTLKQWIKKRASEDTPAFIVSASILLPRLLSLVGRPAMAMYADSWPGYPRSLYEILVSCFDCRAHRIVFLSGDEHLSCLATITLTCLGPLGHAVKFHSIHSSGLYSPFPFANSTQDDFKNPDTFEFDHDDGANLRHFRCSVSTFFPGSGDGFALIAAKQSERGWTLDVEFSGESEPVLSTINL